MPIQRLIKKKELPKTNLANPSCIKFPARHFLLRSFQSVTVNFHVKSYNQNEYTVTEEYVSSG